MPQDRVPSGSTDLFFSFLRGGGGDREGKISDGKEAGK